VVGGGGHPGSGSPQRRVGANEAVLAAYANAAGGASDVAIWIGGIDKTGECRRTIGG